ncbi:hypothetical protein H696_00124 [Fonticula alba]|uniref:RRM domain-containing protein n=1 Tax=Fonticula alba TaxID=691883 RepID=A0A058ZGC5_FONAL|nr:hypothetical protein H696_00124 [Fonticula alba]KCV72532.1 hypothetical protein H696_00124 [Fonticula alba]|eukprot:XP_009492233.1 hypothetical protein H696_00124 [Fonticula alba]
MSFLGLSSSATDASLAGVFAASAGPAIIPVVTPASKPTPAKVSDKDVIHSIDLHGQFGARRRLLAKKAAADNDHLPERLMEVDSEEEAADLAEIGTDSDDEDADSGNESDPELAQIRRQAARALGTTVAELKKFSAAAAAEAQDSDDEGDEDDESATPAAGTAPIPADPVVDRDSPERRQRTVFIGNLPAAVMAKAGKRQLRKLLTPHGKVESIRFRSVAVSTVTVPKRVAISRGMFNQTRAEVNAYVVFGTRAEARSSLALNGTFFEVTGVGNEAKAPETRKRKRSELDSDDEDSDDEDEQASDSDPDSQEASDEEDAAEPTSDLEQEEEDDDSEADDSEDEEDDSEDEDDTMSDVIMKKAKNARAEAALPKAGGRHLRFDLLVHKVEGEDDLQAAANMGRDLSRTIFLGNVPFNASDEDIRSHFRSCGEIEYIRMIRDRVTQLGKGFAYVCFRKASSLSLAFRLNNQPMLLAGAEGKNSRKLRISQARPTDNRPILGSRALDHTGRLAKPGVAEKAVAALLGDRKKGATGSGDKDGVKKTKFEGRHASASSKAVATKKRLPDGTKARHRRPEGAAWAGAGGATPGAFVHATEKAIKEVRKKDKEKRLRQANKKAVAEVGTSNKRAPRAEVRAKLAAEAARGDKPTESQKRRLKKKAKAEAFEALASKAGL